MRPLVGSGFALALVLAGSAAAFGAPALTAQATAGASNLVLDGMGTSSTHIVKVGVISISTSAGNGFTLSISSGNLSKAAASSVGYQVVLVDRDASAPSAAAFTITSGSTYTFTTSGPSALEKDLYVKYLPAFLQDPGAYTANIVLGVVDN